MNFTQFLLILKARFKIVLAILGLVVFTTLIINLLTPKSYKATSSLVLNYKGVDPVTGLTLPAQLMPGYMATQIDIITSRSVALKVVEDLKFAENQSAQRQFQEATGGKGDIRGFFADKLMGGVEAKPSRESSVIEISFSGTDPDFAATMANAFADAYQATSIRLKNELSQKASGFLGEKTVALRKNLEETEAKLSKYQQEKGLTSIMGNLDVESARLNELSSQLVQAQSQSYDSSSRQLRARGNADDSPDVAANPVVQNLNIEITHAESKLSELGQRIGTSHPHYQQAEAELLKLKSQLIEAKHKAGASIGGSAHINQQRESELRAALAAQKKRVLELNLSRDQLAVFQRDVENAQRAVDSASQRFTQTALEGSSNQADIAVLSPAIAPQNKSSPRVMFNLVLAGFLGTFLGILIGLLVEYIDSRVRSREDAIELLQAPVLAMINNKPILPMAKALAEFVRLTLDKLKRKPVTQNGEVKPFKVSISRQMLSQNNSSEAADSSASCTDPVTITLMQPYAPQMDALRGLRSRLLMRGIDHNRNSLAIVSANADEGNAYLAANLAMMLAKGGKRTLLIDANLREPHQHHIFNIKANAGLADILAGNVDLVTSTQVGALDNLHLITAGAVTENSHKLLGLSKFDQILKQAEAQFEFVLIDVAPTLHTADAQDVIKHCGAVLLVSRLNQTRQADLKELRDQIAVTGIQVIGSVVNDF
jgi:chain length determinant protein EpsF